MKNKKSIKIRILKSTLLLVTIILLGIFVAFNMLLNHYINENANKNLSNAQLIVKNYNYEDLNEFKFEKFNNPNHEKKEIEENENLGFQKCMKHLIKYVKDKTNVESMIVDEDNELIYPVSEDYYIYDITQLENITRKIEDEIGEIKEVSSQIKYSSDESYYFSIEKLDRKYNNKTCYIILFVNTHEQLELANNINKFLFVLMCIAGILTIFTTLILSEKISKPIKQISEFAKQIGNGDFTESNMKLEDKELDELLKVMNKSAQYLDKYDKDQKTFFQNISHELRTPLMSIMGYAEAIKYNLMETDKACDIILEEGDKLKEMIEELLYISRMDNISKDIKLSNCDIREILSSCVESKQATAINKNINLICDFDEKPLMYLCDEKSLRRAFLNIIENGLRYATSQIIVTCKSIDKKIKITIENDGEKIEDKDMPYIFDRFYKGKNGKSGIGLSIVKSIVNKHNGEIYCENTNTGVKFTIYLKNKDS